MLRFVKECNTCQQNKVEHTHPAGVATTHYRTKMGEHFYGFYHRDTVGIGEGLYLCGC